MSETRPDAADVTKGLPPAAASEEAECKTFPIHTNVLYEVTSRNVLLLHGSGITINLSRRRVVFWASNPFASKQVKGEVTLLIEWPVKLNGKTWLNLEITGPVQQVDGYLVTVTVGEFEFRPRYREAAWPHERSGWSSPASDTPTSRDAE